MSSHNHAAEIDAATQAVIDELKQRIAALEDERYQIMLEIMGGEDAPGAATRCTLDDVRRAVEDHQAWLQDAESRAETAEARADGLAEALRFYADEKTYIQPGNPYDFGFIRDPEAKPIEIDRGEKARAVFADTADGEVNHG